MKPLYAYIPSNLDLTTERHRDKFYFIITFIFYGILFDKRKSLNSFAQLYSPYLKKILNGRYKDYIQDLIDEEIIETDNRYIKKLKSKSYRLTEKYSKSKVKRVEITDSKIISNYWKYKEEKKKEITEGHYKFLFNCLEQIEIDYDSAIAFLDKIELNFEQFNSYYCSIERIKNKDWFFIIDKTAGRVHNNLTNLPKIFRPFLRYNNQKLVEIDISNCQPLLFNILISKYFLKDQSVFDSCINSPSIPENSDLRLYKELTEKGKFYEFMMDQLGVKEEREKFKVRMFTKIFYGKEEKSQERTQFEAYFTEVSKIISYYKRVNYKKLSVELQTEEAELMLNNILPILAKNKIFVLTIHDSFLTTHNNIELVKEVIMSEFKKKGLRPTLKIKS
uniref:Uncharacterized protein n=1 Tax=Ignavibacterium album TaxID=591197 RepID=A0A7V3E7I4_9BACT